MSGEHAPSWLQAALGRTFVLPVGFAEEGESPLKAIRGEIRVARPMDEEKVSARLIVILEAYTDGDPWVNACLINNALEAAGDKDVRLDAEDTNLSFPTLVETDVVGPLFMIQLGPRIGQLAAPLLDELRAAVYGTWGPNVVNRRGTPIMGKHDARWRLKEQEIGEMHALAYACMDHLIKADVKETAADLVLDPAFIRPDAVEPPLATMLRVVSVAEDEGLNLDIPTEGSHNMSRLRNWAASLMPDEVRALESLWQGCLKSDEPKGVFREDQLNWRLGWPSPGANSLAQHLAAHASRGGRAFRVATSRKNWPEGTQGGVIGLDVEGIGTVQVKPELLDVAA